MANLQRVGVGAVMLPNESSSSPTPASSSSNEPNASSSPPSIPLPLPPPPMPMPPMPMPPMPTVPYPSQPSIPFVPPGAKTWLQEHPLVLPVGGSIAALIVGLTIGVAVGRRRMPRAAF